MAGAFRENGEQSNKDGLYRSDDIGRPRQLWRYTLEEDIRALVIDIWARQDHDERNGDVVVCSCETQWFGKLLNSAMETTTKLLKLSE